MELSVIILNKDKPELIDNCLRSIFAHTRDVGFEVVVGDTGSSSELVANVYNKYSSQYPNQFRFIDAGKYNFSRNNNTVAAVARGEIFLFLNNDTLILDNSLRALVSFIKQDQSIGCLGPKLVFGYNRKVQHAGIEFFKHPVFGILGYHPHAGKHASLSDVNSKKIVPAVTGACLLVRADDFKKVNGFNEAYIAEAQDVDLCLKVSALGKKSVYNGTQTIIHLENGSRPSGEENRADRRRLLSAWGSRIKSEFLNSRFQFQHYDSIARQQFDNSKKVLFERIKARGDVLASLRLCKMLKARDKNIHITFKTEFFDLVDSSPYVDRVLAMGEVDTWTYDHHYLPTYEDGTWKGTDLKWIEQMAKSIGLPTNISDEPMTLNISEYDKMTVEANLLGLPEKYVVVSTGAGWTEREWSPEQWDNLAQELFKLGYAIVQIGGETDYQIPDAFLRLNKNLQTNYAIVDGSQGAVMLDSFPLHVAMMTNKPVVILTCKTCHFTVWYRSQVKEIRNRWAAKTPLPNCREEGCRLRYGNGLDNPCTTPILKEMNYKQVLEEIKKHFSIEGEKLVTY